MTERPVIRTRSARRRLAAFGAVAGLTTATAVVITPAGAQPAAAAQSAESHAVVSGNARFEVLSPTLIRTEYAGDAKFLNASTFNAIGRNDFGNTKFTTSTTDGWLTIRTGSATLRYKVGSGAFTAENLKLAVHAGQQEVSSSPWASEAAPSCTLGQLCEAEDLKLAGPTLATDHGGYTGRGFAAGFSATGNSMTFDVKAADAATYDLALRYANSTGGDGQNVTRTLSVIVDNGSPTTISLPKTGSWDTWELAKAPVKLSAGTHTVKVVRGASDSGNVNVDSLAVVDHDAAYPAPTPPTSSPCDFGSICEADTGTLSGGAKKASDHNGYSGDGFVAGLERTSSADSFTVTDVPAAGDYNLQLRYANWAAGSKPVQARQVSVTVGSADATTATLQPTSSWDTWRTVNVPVKLAAGDNTVSLGCPDVDSCNVNLDTVAFTPTSSPLLAPHAPLGGYRRGLDGVNGSALTAPGLLYQDGWSLLNDTPSAVYDPATEKVTPRPEHADGTYQDGYVFAYGQDYRAGLQDLSTLTGPSALLPRWVYGIWYSEYYDRTASDFKNTIVPKFRSEGVPLDVLVVDTDYKSPNKWNGWEIDKSRIPDPSAFFDWAHSEGLHTSLNIHPSILAADPKFEQAQKTAKGKLKPGACSGGGKDCYVFDFGDPDQLKAYMELHKSMEDAGNDLWWMDWCCDQSTSSLAGVTGDSWVNQKYADGTAPRIGGRGFAFSRAYGSLQAGGYSNPVAVPTGPWADKRTTLHFTGDTISDWETLKYEIGYTGSESVATGLSNISHDIGGHTGGLQEPGTEPDSTKLPDDLYARWVQMGTFQPVDRLHSNHSDRLPWQYGAAAKSSAEKFLNLRENLVPYTYTLAQQATATGAPIVQPLYLNYPEQQDAYANADSEYLYGPDVLVAPVATPGKSATTRVWFPAGDSWTDYFTGKTYEGGTYQDITTGLDTMPVFIRSGGIMTTRTSDVSGDVQHPLDAVTVTAAEGAAGSFDLYEDNGTTTDASQHATTRINYRLTGNTHRVTVDPAVGDYEGKVAERVWTVSFRNATAPKAVSVNGHKVGSSSWSWDASTRTLTVHAPKQSTGKALRVTYK
ncbi:TIM-barrel domain-containing protein [Flexivirga endophytica]|uniref:TIM-barrel domain-containing protein n=1 Tax=Flexivirga endophytica TaxID=1849103 RepID=UPI001E5C9BB4|nr:TIM-barrel domain-containing protein [Flexivirga endophytica]